MATMGSHIARVGKNLDQATGAYNAFVGSFESQVLTQAKRFEALDIETGGKEIAALPVAERPTAPSAVNRSEEHTSELQSLMRSYFAVFCVKKKNYTMQVKQDNNTD